MIQTFNPAREALRRVVERCSADFGTVEEIPATQRGRDDLRLAGELAAADPLGAVLDAIAEPSAFTWDNPTGVIR